MHKTSHLKTSIGIAGGIMMVLLIATFLLPVLNQMLEVKVNEAEPVAVTQSPLPESSEKPLVTVFYEMGKESKKISNIYIEVFHPDDAKVFYLQLPVDTKVTLSEELYKSLQAYAPELPQYFKLSNMAESFSMEYGLTGCNRILSELLGISLKHYMRVEADTLEYWWKALSKERTAKKNFETYTGWLEETSSDLSLETRWMYFESWKNVGELQIEQAPGTQEKDGFLLSGKRSKERLQEMMAGKETTLE